MATTKIHRTFGTPTNLDKWTYSGWIKRQSTGVRQYFFEGTSGASNFTSIVFDTTDRLEFSNYNSGYLGRVWSTAFYRDPGAWYHIVAVWDSDNATPADRIKLYVNGVQVTSHHALTNPTLGEACQMASGDDCWIGVHQSTNDYFSGEMSWVQFVDGSALAPTEFGEFDSTSGIWKIKTTPYATPGNNGFCLKMEDRTNLDLDSSSNAHTFTTTGTLTATYDSPSNNFCTMNPLDNYFQSATFSEGNNTTLIATAVACYATGTMGMTSGKWYWEQKGVTNTGGFQVLPGIAGRLNTSTTEQELGEAVDTYGYYSSNGDSYNNATGTSYGDTFVSGDIIGIAVDLDNNKLYFSKNGTWQNSGVPTSGATGTGAISLMAASATYLGAYFPAFTGGWGGSVGHYGQYNFGNGYFGTTAVSSAQADDAGIGAMEYDVPAGYYCLCTKNIKAYG